jgi:DoxX
MLWGILIAVVEFFGGIAILLDLYAEFAAALFAFQTMVGTFWKFKIKKVFSDYSYDMQLCRVLMSQGAGAYTIGSFPGDTFALGRRCVLAGGRVVFYTLQTSTGNFGADRCLISIRATTACFITGQRKGDDIVMCR